jgi:hypothetical protein
MASQVGIFNMALGRLGISTVVRTLAEESTERKICSVWYDQTLDFVQRDFPYPFTTTAAPLAVSVDTFPGWTYAYAYPSGCLNIHAICDETGLRPTMGYALSFPERLAFIQRPVPWKIASATNGVGRVILTDQQNAYAVYTRQYTDTESMPPDFVSTFAWRLAFEVGSPLKADPAMSNRALQMYFQEKGTTGATALNEAREDLLPDSPSILARG